METQRFGREEWKEIKSKSENKMAGERDTNCFQV